MRKNSGGRKKWSGLISIEPNAEQKLANVSAVYVNELVTVFVKEVYSPSFTDPSGPPQLVWHLMLNWAKGLNGSDEYFYILKQRIKSELCGKDSDCVEIIPGQWREQDTKQTHLWVLTGGNIIPIGLLPKDVDAAIEDSVGGAENMLSQEDVEVFLVEYKTGDGSDDSILEVFASEEECKSAYGDNDIPASAKKGIRMIGDVPAESNTVAWSQGAKAKLVNVISKAEASNAAAGVCAFVHDASDDDDDRTLEEKMNDRLAALAEDRASKVRAVTEEVVGRKPNIVLVK